MTSGVHKCCRLEKSHKNRAHAMQSPDSPISEVGLQDFEDGESDLYLQGSGSRRSPECSISDNETPETGDMICYSY